MGPDNWHDKITGADLLISAHKLLEIENISGQNASQIVAPSRHSLTLGQELRSDLLRFIVGPHIISYIQSLTENSSGTIQFNVMFSRENVVAFMANCSPINEETWRNPTLPTELEKTTCQIEGYFFKTTLKGDILKLKQLERPFDFLEAQDFDVSQLRTTSASLALIIDDNDGLHLFLTSNKNEWMRFTQVNISNLEENSRHNIEYKNIRTKKVGIVGLGSAGSKIALSLGSVYIFCIVMSIDAKWTKPRYRTASLS